MADDIKIDYKKAGFNFTLGVIYALGLCMLIGWVIISIFVPKDDCDVSRWTRCGMMIATDHKTGKEYLLSPHGGIIERGKP